MGPTTILTRYLYNIDDVYHTLLCCMLIKTTFEETLFWMSEIYYSGYKEPLWEFLWKIYYDFYAIRNPKFEKIIKKSHAAWCKDGKIENVVVVVNILYHCSAKNPQVFIMRMSVVKTPNTLYGRRDPRWVKKMTLTKKERNLIRSIDEESVPDIIFYLAQLAREPQRCYNIICEYFKKKRGMNLKDGSSIDDLPYSNKKHILTALICHLLLPEKQIIKRVIYPKVKKAYLEMVKNTEKYVIPCRKTLRERRLYGINPIIGAFKSNRKSDNIGWKEKLWYHWEFYARNCPVWKERFGKYKATFDGETKTIIFPNADIEEDFYEKHGLEPDEQTKECQYMSIGDIDDTLSVKEWLKKTHKRLYEKPDFMDKVPSKCYY